MKNLIPCSDNGLGRGEGSGEENLKRRSNENFTLIFSLYTGAAPPVMCLLQAFIIR